MCSCRSIFGVKGQIRTFVLNFWQRPKRFLGNITPPQSHELGLWDRCKYYAISDLEFTRTRTPGWPPDIGSLIFTNSDLGTVRYLLVGSKIKKIMCMHELSPKIRGGGDSGSRTLDEIGWYQVNQESIRSVSMGHHIHYYPRDMVRGRPSQIRKLAIRPQK